MSSQTESRTASTPHSVILFLTFPAQPRAMTVERQRKIGTDMAERAGLLVVHEIIETGAGDSELQNRLAYQALQQALLNHPDVRYVLVPRMPRASKYYYQDIGRAIRQLGARMFDASAPKSRPQTAATLQPMTFTELVAEVEKAVRASNGGPE